MSNHLRAFTKGAGIALLLTAAACAVILVPTLVVILFTEVGLWWALVGAVAAIAVLGGIIGVLCHD